MPDKWTAWLSVNLTNAAGGIVLLAAGLIRRRDAAAHKRLMILGTIALTEPGFSRIWLPWFEARLGEGYLPFYVSTYIGTAVLVVAVGLYDLLTRRRLHPVYLPAVLWMGFIYVLDPNGLLSYLQSHGTGSRPPQLQHPAPDDAGVP